MSGEEENANCMSFNEELQSIFYFVSTNIYQASVMCQALCWVLEIQR